MRLPPDRTIMLIREDRGHFRRNAIVYLALWCGAWMGVGAAQWIKAEWGEMQEVAR